MSNTVKTILYTSDLTADAPEVFRHAVGLAEQFDAKLHAFTVRALAPMHPFAQHISAEKFEEIKATDRDNRAAELQQRIDKFAADNPDCDVKKVLASVKAADGDAAPGILEAADNMAADMIVMGSRGRSAIGEIFLGSVASKVTMKAKVPVVLVPIS